MKAARLLLAALALALAAAPAGAAMKTHVGPIVGLNLGILSIDGVGDMGTRLDVGIGGSLDLGLNDRWGIRVEPMFISKGSKNTERNAWLGVNDELIFRLSYVDVPVMARFDLSDASSTGYLLGGFGVGFATKSEVEIKEGSFGEKVDFKDVFKSTDFTVNVGAGIGFPIGAQRLNFDARGAFGLIDINEGGEVTFRGNPVVVPDNMTRTVSFQVFATLLFPVGG